ncbi:MAG: metal-sensitive transcriptional regulator [Candidatus Moranbacteria bacterium]|nr:metal-sensitive transcriptional regulator [Candidatus Moranbacteria bacterium]
MKKQRKNTALSRIARIEGQLKGIRRMMEERAECLDIITQVSAVREAVGMLGVELLKDDITCKWDGKKKIDETYLKNLFKMR